METKHTPGPWNLEESIHAHRGHYVGKDGDLCQRFPWEPFNEESRAMALANARLIAAAPDLLAALKMSLSVFDKQRELLRDGCKDIPCPRDEALDILRAAIAKATA